MPGLLKVKSNSRDSMDENYDNFGQLSKKVDCHSCSTEHVSNTSSISDFDYEGYAAYKKSINKGPDTPKVDDINAQWLINVFVGGNEFE